ncbi:histidinol dehydrogenase [Legionella spiritensis]|uniref:Histidinol dehydrogenase n=1 Tax=Legionella spiritensis TaxID=452 RepID=A0A0W0Z6R7_LEGSP|nr:histidinol dehydrogenase [Legionella spiritensis]KTD64816.1 histidinol dehydrogenase [Legionella spiritensis]SNV40386.1 histidinol dehydrogenase [Legionella spiritensis]
MLAVYQSDVLSRTAKNKLLARPQDTYPMQDQTLNIINAVKEGGDKAMRAFTREFDGVDIGDVRVTPEELLSAAIDREAEEAILTAINNLRIYHQATRPETTTVRITDGVLITRRYQPIQRVGLYVPGGRNTPLVSSLLMQAIPAAIAGCPVKIVCTPPDSQGGIDPHLLVAARLCGIDTLFKVGGAQAIAAMAYGTETIPKVDKIFGPGNRFVTTAKTLVSIDPNGAGIDMPAGPSEVMVAADDHANPDLVAADLLAQAEHGPDSQVVLLCDSQAFAKRVNDSLITQLSGLSRKPVIAQALQHSVILVCDDREETTRLINDYAPEHLIINRNDADILEKGITAAGTIFIGPWGAETLGDYVTGSNHVLPTGGYARSHSGLGTMDFLTAMTVQAITAQGLASLGKAACTLARLEGLDAHANAVQQRLSIQEKHDVSA